MKKQTYIIGILLITMIGMILGFPSSRDLNNNPQIPKEIINEDIEMKREQFAAITGTNDDLEDLQNFHIIGEYDGDFYYVMRDTQDLIIKSVNGLTGSTSTEHTLDMTKVGAIDYIYYQEKLRIVKVGTKQYLSACIYQTTNILGVLTGQIWHIFKNLTDGGAYIDDEISVAPTDDGGLIVDIFSFGSTIDIIYFNYDNDDFNYITVNVATGAGTDQGTFLSDAIFGDNCIYPGNYDGTNYKFFYKDNLNVAQKATVPSNWAASISGDTGVILAASNEAVQLYWDFGNIEYLIDEDHFYTRVGGLGSWANYSEEGTTTNAVVWDYDANDRYIPVYIVWKDALYKIFTNGYIFKLQNFTDDAYVGWEDWVNNGADTIYQLSLATFDASRCVITSEFLMGPRIDITIIDAPITNQGLVIYDENSSLRAVTYIKDYEQQKDKQYKYICESPIKYDLETDVSFTSDTDDTPDILKYVIDTYCRFLYYGTSSISTTPATTYSLPFTGTVKSVFEWACKQEGYFLSIRPDGEVYFNQMTASGETLTFGTNAMSEPRVIPRNLKLSYISIKGAFVNGEQLTSEKYGEPNFGTFRDEFPEIDNQTDLDSMRDSILSQRNETVTEYITTTHAVRYFEIGETVTLTDSIYSISADTYYIYATIWNLLPENKMCSVKMKSALYLSVNEDKELKNPKMNAMVRNIREEIKSQTGNNQQHIAKISDEVAQLMAVGAANAQWHPCVFELEQQVGKIYWIAGRMVNVDGTDSILGWNLPLPFTKGSLKLYVSGVKVNLYDADANDYIGSISLKSLEGTTATTEVTENNGGAGWNSPQIITETFTAIDCSAFDKLVVELNCVFTDAGGFDAGGVLLQYYYA